MYWAKICWTFSLEHFLLDLLYIQVFDLTTFRARSFWIRFSTIADSLWSCLYVTPITTEFRIVISEKFFQITFVFWWSEFQFVFLIALQTELTPQRVNRPSISVEISNWEIEFLKVPKSKQTMVQLPSDVVQQWFSTYLPVSRW